MNFPSLLAGRLRTAAPPQLAVLLAVLLTIALAGSALAQETPPTAPGGPPSNPAENQPSANPPIQPPSSPPSNPPGTSTTPDQTENQPTDPPTTPPTTPTTPTTPPTNQPMTPTPHPQAPRSAPGGCIVSHAATPAQLCRIAGGLQYYFIGADGSSHTGPWLAPFSDLATLHATGAPVMLYSGANSFTSKPIQIYYLPAKQKIRISTYYPDTQYDTDKPYIFTVDSSNSVTHEAW